MLRLRHRLRHTSFLLLIASLLLAIPVQLQAGSPPDSAKSENEWTTDWPPADDSPIDSSYAAFNKYDFKHHRAFHMPEGYRSTDFNRWRIDIYPYDIKDFQDTLHIPLKDNGLQRFTFPIQSGHITSRFGPRELFGRTFHHGTDLRLDRGDTVVASLPGIVRLVRTDPQGYGKFVVISHDNGLETLYGHLSGWLVQKGEHVWAGQPIALGGSSGSSTAPHLHFEFRFMGEEFNPETFISFQDTSLKRKHITITRELFTYKFNPGTYNSGKEAEHHIVSSGQTLSYIARRYGTTISKLCKLNNMEESDLLRVGQKLRVQ